MPPNPQKLAKWEREIDRIRWQVVRLLDRRRWNEIYERVVNAHPKLHPGIPILDHFRNVYGDYAVLAVRRLAKPGRDSVSLVDLIQDVRDGAESLDRAWYRSLYKRPHANGTIYSDEMAFRLADSTFKRFIDRGMNYVSRALIERDLDEVVSGTRHLIHISDRAIAHDDRRGVGAEFGALTFNEIDVAVRLVERLTGRYLLLLTGEFALSMTPIDTTDALRVFRFPWIDDEHPPDLPPSLNL